MEILTCSVFREISQSPVVDRHYLPLPFWERALAAAVFSTLVEVGLRKTLLAAVAALLLVWRPFLAMIFVLAIDPVERGEVGALSRAIALPTSVQLSASAQDGADTDSPLDADPYYTGSHDGLFLSGITGHKIRNVVNIDSLFYRS